MGLPKTILLYVICGTLAGIVVSLLTPPEDHGRTMRFFLLLRTPIGHEQVLRDAGLVEIPGTGSFEEPPAGCSLPAPTLSSARPSRVTVWGFFIVSVIALTLLGIVKLMAFWLEHG